MSTADVRPVEASRRGLAGRLFAQGFVAAIGLAIGAVAGFIGALLLGLIGINC
jgi:hypothetical protein